MNRSEANAVLAERVERYKRWSYAELAQLVDYDHSFPITAPAGSSYQFELQVQWDDRPGGSLRVTCSLRNNDLKAFDQVTAGFVVRPVAGTR